MEIVENTTLMRTLHDAWNDKDWHKFEKLHSKNTVVYWPDETEKISGRMENCRKAKRLSHKFSQNRIQNGNYKVLFGQGDWTCSVAIFKGIIKDTITVNETKIGPTNKPFEVELCTVAQWKDGEIVKEKLFLTL
ncbi:ester cyclase [Methanosarcina sp. MSH10X1]|nr:ester cyclase [Methanosarcina sp. MSH10X1]